MEFNKIVLEKLEPLMNKYNISVIEQRTGYLRLGSQNLIIIISHNPFENSNTFWVGRNEKESIKIEIDNKVLLEFFNSNLKLNKVSYESFANNLVSFFEKEGESLLNNTPGKINELEQFHLKRSQEYTDKVLKRGKV